MSEDEKGRANVRNGVNDFLTAQPTGSPDVLGWLDKMTRTALNALDQNDYTKAVAEEATYIRTALLRLVGR